MRCKTSVHESVSCTSNCKLFALLLEQTFFRAVFFPHHFFAFVCRTRRRALEIVMMMLFVNCILEVIFVYAIFSLHERHPDSSPVPFLFFVFFCNFFFFFIVCLRRRERMCASCTMSHLNLWDFTRPSNTDLSINQSMSVKH